MALTGKRQRFAQEYIIDFNGTQAYIRAGFTVSSPEVAAVEAHRLLRNPNVQREIEKLQEELRDRSELSADMIIQELRSLGFWNIQDFINTANEIKDLTKLSRKTTKPVIGIKSQVKTYKQEDGTVVKEVTAELKMHDKRGALVDLGKHLGIFEKDNEQKSFKIKVTRK